MRTLAVFAAAFALVACDSTDPEPVAVSASAREATLVGAEPSRAGRPLDIVFDYVGDTPSPCYSLHSYGTSSTLPPGERDPDVAVRIEVDVRVADRSEDVCTAELGMVEAELRVPADAAGLYVVAFERPGQAPLERRVRVTLGAAVEE